MTLIFCLSVRPVVIIIVVIAFGPYLCTGRLQELFKYLNPGPGSQVVPRCNPSSLSLPPNRGARCFMGGLAISFPEGSRSGHDVWYRSLAFGECVQFIPGVCGGFNLLMVIVWPILRVMLMVHWIHRISKAGVDECLDLLQS